MDMMEINTPQEIGGVFWDTDYTQDEGTWERIFQKNGGTCVTFKNKDGSTILMMIVDRECQEVKFHTPEL